MTNPTLKALSAKYADLFSEVKRLRSELRAAEYALENVKATILIFDPLFPVGSVKAVRNRLDPRIQTDRNRRAIEILREAEGPMSSRDLAKQSLAEEGNVSPNSLVLDHAAAGIYNFFKKQERRGVARIVSREPIMWRLVKTDRGSGDSSIKLL